MERERERGQRHFNDVHIHERSETGDTALNSSPNSVSLQILLRHLAEIALSKRIDDGQDLKQMHWKDYFATILDMRRDQIERLRQHLQHQEHRKVQPALAVKEEVEKDSQTKSKKVKKKKKSAKQQD